MQALVRRGDADEVVRVATPCHRLPNATVAGVLQIQAGDLLEATRRVEAGSQFIGERLIVNKAIGVGRPDGLFVEALGIELLAFDPRDLSADQRGAVLESVGTIRRPHLELFVMRRKSLHVLLPLSGWRGIAGGGSG